MADNKVKFLRGTSAEYEASTKDNDVFYYITDTKKLYLGTNEVTGEGITVDDVLSDTSENPVQNKVVKTEFDKKAEKSIYGDNSINLGRNPDKTAGASSIAMGTDVEASGIHAHAEGSNTSAIGNHAFAGGIDTEVEGNVSFAYGEGLKTIKYYSAAFGIYNLADENTLFSIGNGNSDTERSNAFEITKTGGKLHNKDLITSDNVATQSTNGLMSAADKAILDKRTAYKLVSSSCQTVSINTSDWNTLSSGGYACEKTLPVGLLYDNYIFEVSLSSDTDAAKLQLQSWNYIMADGRIEQATSSVNGEKAASFTFYAFTTKPTVALTIAIQGVS